MRTANMVLSLIALTVFTVAMAACAPGDTIGGRATITDGDSLEIGSTRIRLFGIDAPEGQQTCTRSGSPWRCGEAAAAKLRSLVDGAALDCTQRDIDSYQRVVAVCRRGELDLNAEMVRAGLALAYRQYGNDYVDAEDEARAANRGLWAGEFTPPWDWRRNPSTAPAEQSSTSNGDCRIKGNINRQGERIYHVPGSPSYDDTRIDERQGERWFCTEAQAVSAGWRPPRQSGNRSR